jgi:broad specificity phosphatase PhoE
MILTPMPLKKLLQIHCFRHGQSAANAGAASADPASIPLTDLGRRQVEALAGRFHAVPERLISSPFLRAQHSAAPMQARFGLSLELWPIQEFTYLSPPRFVGTSQAERRVWVEAYWNAAAPHSIDGEGAESFAAFILRVRRALSEFERLRQTGCRSVVAFGHGQFFQALRWLITHPVREMDSAAMREFQEIERIDSIDNASGFLAVFDGQRWTIEAA